MDRFSIASIGKLNWKLELSPSDVVKDFFTKWPLFADELWSFDGASTNWIEVLPVPFRSRYCLNASLQLKNRHDIDTNRPVISSLHQPFFCDNHQKSMTLIDASLPPADCHFSTILMFFPHLELHRKMKEKMKDCWMKCFERPWNVSETNVKFEIFQRIYLGRAGNNQHVLYSTWQLKTDHRLDVIHYDTFLRVFLHVAFKRDCFHYSHDYSDHTIRLLVKILVRFKLIDSIANDILSKFRFLHIHLMDRNWIFYLV